MHGIRIDFVWRGDDFEQVVWVLHLEQRLHIGIERRLVPFQNEHVMPFFAREFDRQFLTGIPSRRWSPCCP